MNAPLIIPLDSSARERSLVTAYNNAYPFVSGEALFAITVPLRICPLGAHSDHQGGVVTGMTIDRSITLCGQLTAAPSIAVTSLDFNEKREVSLTQPESQNAQDWANYIRGAVRALIGQGQRLSRGFQAVISGQMPIGGLSSSAAVTLAYLHALNYAQNATSTQSEYIELVRIVENEYLGLQNGILDQSVIVASQPDHLTRIDCRSREITLIKPATVAPTWSILVVYSGLSRSLVATPFNQRVQECREAARTLLKLMNRPVTDGAILGDISSAAFIEYRDRLPETLRKRATHFFEERERVERGVAAWQRADINSFGELITASGASSITNYESGSPALISLYRILSSLPGVYGTRFCGGGFQGCCLALVHPDMAGEICQKLHAQYRLAHPELESRYSIHLCHSSNGPTVKELA